MAQVTFSMPRMLAGFTDGKRRFAVDAQTIEGALRAAEEAYPLLRVHLFDEKGALREHVQIFVNATDCRDLASLEAPVSEGDEIIVLQAISGGLVNPVVAGAAGVPPGRDFVSRTATRGVEKHSTNPIHMPE